MTVTIEPLAIDRPDGRCIEYRLVRRVGRHLDAEMMPDSIRSDAHAHAWAAKRWRVPESAVRWAPVRVVDEGGVT